MFLKDSNNFTVDKANTLTTARTINGTSFNGSANITTANWGTARNLQIGNTAKSVNGSANVTWSLSEIGAAAASHGKHVPDTCTSITDWNAATTTGWYMGNNATNSPTANAWYFGEVIAHNTNYVVQTVYQFTASTDAKAIPKYIRAKMNGTWGAWTNVTVAKAVPSNAVFTDTNTWRGVQDNLTSTATDQSLSANQGKVLKGLIDGKAASSHNHGLLHDNLGVSVENTTTDNGWSMINSSYNGFILKSIRSNQSAPAWLQNNYAAGIAFGGADTKGVMSVAYNAPSVRFAGGNGTKPVWNFTLTGVSGKTYNLDSMVTNTQFKITIPSGSWAADGALYSNTITHNLNKEILYISAYDSSTKKSIFTSYTIVNNNSVKVSIEQPLNVVLTIVVEGGLVNLADGGISDSTTTLTSTWSSTKIQNTISGAVKDGTTSQKGVVQLSSATNSTSTTLAATASAVKAAYDLANNKIDKSSVTISTADPSGGKHGDIWFKYE